MNEGSERRPLRGCRRVIRAQDAQDGLGELEGGIIQGGRVEAVRVHLGELNQAPAELVAFGFHLLDTDGEDRGGVVD